MCNLREETKETVDPFNGNQGQTQKGRDLRKNLTIKDCEINNKKEEDEMLKDTMAFVTSCLPKQTKQYA